MHERALADLMRVIDLDPGDTAALNNLGLVHRCDG